MNLARPTELVIGKEDEEWLRSTAAAAAARGGVGEGLGIEEGPRRRKEVWEEGGEAMEREGTPGRLGVLPSPRLEAGFGSMSERGGILGVGAVIGGQESEMRREGEGEEASRKSELEMVPASPSRTRSLATGDETDVADGMASLMPAHPEQAAQMEDRQ